MSTVPTNRGDITPGEVISELVYIAYACQRSSSPEISPERWAQAGFRNVPAMEARYQAELAVIRAKVSSEFPL